ncbi:unnamed protein product [Sphagnum tenellum]
MQQEGVQPNSVPFAGVLNACASMVVVEGGRCVYQQISQSGSGSAVFVGSSLVDMYVCEEGYSQMISLLCVFCQLVAMQF